MAISHNASALPKASGFIADSVTSLDAVQRSPRRAHSVESDPVVFDGRRLADLQRAYWAADEANLHAEGAEEVRFRRVERHLLDAIKATENALTQMRANTFAGAIAQLCVMSGFAGMLYGNLSVEDQDSLAEANRAFERCAYSILGVLAEAAEIDPASVGTDAYMPPHLDPLCQVEEVLAFTGKAANL